jgi:hypothetical protein
MSRRKIGPATRRKPVPETARRSTDRRLVAIDQEPARRKAASECSKQLSRLEKARLEWKQFDRVDKPEFDRWMASTFGALLTSLRENDAKIHEMEALIREVEAELLSGARGPRDAYARVMRRREISEAAARRRAESPPPEGGTGEGSHSDPGHDTEFDEAMLFEEFLRTFMGINPDRLSDAKYEKMFEDFQANFRGQPPPEAARRTGAPHHPPKSEQSRIKEIYRMLVRRLHPDTRSAKDADVSALWHEVQEAYSHGNLERLEMLLALTDIKSNAAGGHTSLFQMRQVLAELRRAYNALRRNLGVARKNPAWNFSGRKHRTDLEADTRRRIESDLARQKMHLREIEALIGSWSAPQQTRRRSARSDGPEFPW